MLWYDKLCYDKLCSAVLCYAMLCCAMLRYGMIRSALEAMEALGCFCRLLEASGRSGGFWRLVEASGGSWLVEAFGSLWVEYEFLQPRSSDRGLSCCPAPRERAQAFSIAQ